MVNNFSVTKELWQEYIIIPDNFRKWKAENLFIEKLVESIKREGFADFRGDLVFDDKNTFKDFMINYKSFFYDSFYSSITSIVKHKRLLELKNYTKKYSKQEFGIEEFNFKSLAKPPKIVITLNSNNSEDIYKLWNKLINTDKIEL